MSIAEKLQTAADNQQKVYDAGKQAEYDAFWDAFQSNGAVRGYQYMFAGTGWTPESFKPKHHICATSVSQMFMNATNLNIDLHEHLTALGVELNFSFASSFSEMLYGSAITGIGTVDTQKASSLGHIFRNAPALKNIRLLILKNDGSQVFNTQSFQDCLSLENIVIEGIVGHTINFQWSPLSKASIESVLTALSTTSTGETATFKKNAVEAAFTMDEWNALVAAKPNWTVTLV